MGAGAASLLAALGVAVVTAFSVFVFDEEAAVIGNCVARGDGFSVCWA